MSIEKLTQRNNIEANRKLAKAYIKMQDLIEAFNKKDLPKELETNINDDIKLINTFSGSDRELTKFLRKKYSAALKIVEEKLKYVTKFHHRNLGIAFGLLAGVVFTPLLERLEFMGMGSSIGVAIPLAMIIGLVIGNNLDQQAEKDGRQLDLVNE
jgi:hypothetical protein